MARQRWQRPCASRAPVVTTAVVVAAAWRCSARGFVAGHVAAGRRAAVLFVASASAEPLWQLPLSLQDDQGAGAIAEHVLSEAPAGDIRRILEMFDSFSAQNRLGMHLGEEKGELIEAAVGRGLPLSGPAVVLETGCHAGDGSLRAALAVSAREGSTLVSTEANQKWLAAARAVVSHGAGSIPGFRFLPLQLSEDASFSHFLDMLRNSQGISRLDAIILDQDPRQYKSQVQLMIRMGMVRQGATIYIDNVVTKKPLLQDYLEMVQQSAQNTEWHTEIYQISRPYTDAVAISTYLGESSENHRGVARKVD
ncbi:unnamed protein product [Prorocentrum cordatum]|uniref:catechol O-methyltransferase n=1 Tax=Prorocentrum cordatum TaxID=2364126 RepID=A0ABN9TIU3_9DINO|nr:unnamed protein product [Polarella glacialis]